MFVLDTCIISELARPKGKQAVLDWLVEDRSRKLGIPTAVIVEIQRGIENLRPREKEKAEKLESWFEAVLRSDIVELPMDSRVARLYGIMTAVSALRGFWVPDPRAERPKLGQDLLIAATAIVHEATLVSMDTRGFARIDRYFPLPGFVCPGKANPFEFARPPERRRRQGSGRMKWTAFPRTSVSKLCGAVGNRIDAGWPSRGSGMGIDAEPGFPRRRQADEPPFTMLEIGWPHGGLRSGNGH